MYKYFIFVIALFVIASCSLDDPAKPDPEMALVLVQTFELDILEPSDLCYDEDSHSLWTVSDADNNVYNIDLEGNVIGTLPFTGNDLEGVAFSKIDSTLWLAEEHLSQIVQINRQGDELTRFQTSVTEDTNSGLEGITFNQMGHICVVKEKDPGMFLMFDNLMQVELEVTIDFADDFAAISYNPDDNFYWIVSDQNETLYAWTIENGVTQEYNLPFSKPEGVAYVPGNNSFYFVSDSLNELYEMKLQVVGDIE